MPNDRQKDRREHRPKDRKEDRLVRLPDHVTAALLRALMSIRPRPERG